MNRRSEQGQATRDHLVAVATELFGRRGYEGTSIEAVLEAAGVSRGSLYHHFASKEALFEAAMQAVETRVGEATLASMEGTTDAESSLRAGCLAWIRLARDPVVQRIILGGLKAVMGLAALEGRIPRELVDVFAHTILVTMNEIALMIVRSDDPDATQRTAEAAVDELLGRLLGPSPRSG